MEGFRLSNLSDYSVLSFGVRLCIIGENRLKKDQIKLSDHMYQKTDFPLAAVAYYGPDDMTASKVVVAILGDNQQIIKSVNWSTEANDIRFDAVVAKRIKEFINAWQIKKIVIAKGILGCPHIPGTDFPLGEDCPFCPFWANKET